MAIEFARARFISRSKGGNAVRSAAYNARDTLESERTGERFSYQDQGTLAFHEIMLPKEPATDSLIHRPFGMLQSGRRAARILR